MTKRWLEETALHCSAAQSLQEEEMCKHDAAWSAVGTVYADGGREVRCAAREGAPDHLCGRTIYYCRHGIEHPKGMPMMPRRDGSPCRKCRAG